MSSLNMTSGMDTPIFDVKSWGIITAMNPGDKKTTTLHNTQTSGTTQGALA